MFQTFKEERAAGPHAWMSQGACQDTDPDLFFPVGAAGPALYQIAEAKAVCGRCPVRRECLGYALETGQNAGVWGGTSEEERRVVRRLALRLARTRSDSRARVGAVSEITSVIDVCHLQVVTLPSICGLGQPADLP